MTGEPQPAGGEARRPLDVAVLVKQVPRSSELSLGPDQRLTRSGVPLELNAYCRRAVSKGVELARASGGRCTVFTMGPASAEDCLREALACGADDGVLLEDVAFAGSDTLATARALAAAVRARGPYDLILAGRGSADADTGHTPIQLAELLGLPMAHGVRELRLAGHAVSALCELEDGYQELTMQLPALVTCAERLISPAKANPAERALVDAARITRVTAAELGPGPWGAQGSPTTVGAVSLAAGERLRLRIDGDAAEQVQRTVELLADLGALAATAPARTAQVPPPTTVTEGVVAVVLEPGREDLSRELLGAGAEVAARLGAEVVALSTAVPDPAIVGGWGADRLVGLSGGLACGLGAELLPAEVVSATFTRWCQDASLRVVLASSTTWGREVAARLATALGAGLIADAVDLGVEGGRLDCHKPAFSGRLIAQVRSTTPIEVVTVRPGALGVLQPRRHRARVDQALSARRSDRMVIHSRTRDSTVERLGMAGTVISVGTGVPPAEYAAIDALAAELGAELAATRKVTDAGWLPHARQVGITGRSVSPQLFIAIGCSGNFNHMVGAQRASTVLAINQDPAAPVFDFADIGLVNDWRAIVPLLAAALRSRTTAERAVGAEAVRDAVVV